MRQKSKVRISRSKPVVAKTYQAPVYQAPAPQAQGVSKTDFDSYVKANDARVMGLCNTRFGNSPRITSTSSSSTGESVEWLIRGVLQEGTMLNTNNGSNEEDVQLWLVQVHSQKSNFRARSSAVDLKDLPPHLEYAFLEGDDKFPVIIAKDLKDEEKAALIKVLKSHKRAIAWKLFDIKGVDPEFCTYKILMEEDYEPTVQSQRRVNPKIHDVIKKEVENFLMLD
ncbi:hypothetical protein Tco_0633130 [Tanacetum coccineum]